MRKKLILIMALFIVFSFIISGMGESKIDKSLKNELDKNGKIRVIIKYNEEIQSKKNILSNEINNKNYIYKNLEYATISEQDLESLADKNVEIFYEPKKNILLQDSIYLTNSTNSWGIRFENENITGKGETVCIIDTGIDFTHQDFGNCYGDNDPNSSCKILGGWDFCADNSTCLTEDSIPEDANGHGTHVAGIVSANGTIKGIAPDSKLIIIKAFNRDGSAYDSDILKGMDWCINNATKFNITTISMSLGNNISHNDYCDDSIIAGPYGENNPPYADKINLAKSKNITVTIATGNDYYTNGISSPACIENATRVGSITKSNTISDFTNRYNLFTDILLTYGSFINSTMPTYDVCLTNVACTSPSYSNFYDDVSGTSMATPMAAGIITLLKQYKKLESQKNLTTDEVEGILINSSTPYEDIPSGGNYSRINSYSAILYSDEKAPTVSLISPENNSIAQLTQNFSCNATDILQLKNITLRIWNLTDIIYENTTNATSNYIQINEQKNLEIDKEYIWTCESYDNNNNLGITENRTIYTSPIIVNQISPKNNNYTKENQTIFNCSAESTSELENLTFYIFNSTELINRSTKNITGTYNFSEFTLNLTQETNYSWYCESSNTENETRTGETNFTITYDITEPLITTISPENEYLSTGTQIINFEYNVSETSNCELILNSEKTLLLSYNNQTNSISKSISPGTYLWRINCSDLAGNYKESTQRTLTINPTPSSGGGGGGSASRTTPNQQKIIEIILTEDELKNGTINNLSNSTKIKILIGEINYSLTLNKINNETIDITFNNQNISLKKYIPYKIDLDNNNFYDIELTLAIIENKNAQLAIRTINEEIPKKIIFEEPIKSEEPTKETPYKKVIQFFKNIINKIKTLRIFS